MKFFNAYLDLFSLQRSLVLFILSKDFLDRIGHALNIYHTQYYTDELTDTIFFVTQQKYAGVNTSSNSIYYLFMTFRVLASKQSKQARDDPIAMFLLR